VYQIYRKDAYAAGNEERLTEGPTNKHLVDWSREDRYLLYSEQTKRRADVNLMALPLKGDRNPILVVEGVTARNGAALSPDGQWVAYGSESSGTLELYVQAFPSEGAPSSHPVQVSVGGGRSPAWRDDSKEIYFTNGLSLMAAAIQVLPRGIRAETPRELFQQPTSFVFNVTGDGRRFLLMPSTRGQPEQSLIVVSHWQATLRH
jgi:Tol biopolymer transport system component